MTMPLDIIIVERLGSIKSLSIKDFKQDELFKKCGFKKPDYFNKQTEWSVKCDGNKYSIQVFGKTEGRSNSENKYDFPPPIDTTLFYGSCAIVAQIKKEDGTKTHTNLSLTLWNKIYEKLFGGFEDLSKTIKEDENEVDELDEIPKKNKTKEGYLKDGFVIDGGESDYNSDESYNDNSDIMNDELKSSHEDLSSVNSELVIDELGSELSEESYDYDDKNVGL